MDIYYLPADLGTVGSKKMTPILYQKAWIIVNLKNPCRDFPGGAVVKNPPANAGDTGSSPGPGRSYMPRSNLSPCTTTTEPACRNY